MNHSSVSVLSQSQMLAQQICEHNREFSIQSSIGVFTLGHIMAVQWAASEPRPGVTLDNYIEGLIPLIAESLPDIIRTIAAELDKVKTQIVAEGKLDETEH